MWPIRRCLRLAMTGWAMSERDGEPPVPPEAGGWCPFPSRPTEALGGAPSPSGRVYPLPELLASPPGASGSDS